MRSPIELEQAYYADLESAQPASAGQGDREGLDPGRITEEEQ